MSDLTFISITGAGTDLYGLEANGHVWTFLGNMNGWVPLNMTSIDDTKAPRISPEAIVAQVDVQEGTR